MNLHEDGTKNMVDGIGTVVDLTRQLRAGASVRFDAFMNTALYAADGYYMENVKIGGEGADFYTAASSPLFARTLARFAQFCWQRDGAPSVYQIVEQGAGEGHLAEHLLPALDACFPNHVQIRYVIVEISPLLKQRQQTRIQAVSNMLSKRMQVLYQPPADTVATCLFANEVLDALPVRRFRHTRHRWEESHVTWSNSGIVEAFSPVTEQDTLEFVRRWIPIPYDTIAEICTSYDDFFRDCRALSTSLTAVWLDYGITIGEWQSGVRPAGTLRAYRQHQLVSPLENPGDVDLTADVHWDYATHAARSAGFIDTQLYTQGQFLMDCGILDVFEASIEQSDKHGLQRAKLSRQVKNLVLPGGLGERFSALVCRVR